MGRGGFQELTIKLAADNGGAWNLMFETILRLLSTLSTRTELQRGRPCQPRPGAAPVAALYGKMGGGYGRDLENESGIAISLISGFCT